MISILAERVVSVEAVELGRAHLLKPFLAEVVRHLDQSIVGSAGIFLQEGSDFAFVTDISITGRLSDNLAQACKTTSLSVLHVALCDQIIVHLIGLRVLILDCENPLHGGLITVGISGDAEEAVLLRQASALIEELRHLEDVAISIILTEVVGTNSAERHSVLRVHNDREADERGLLYGSAHHTCELALSDVVNATNLVGLMECACAVDERANEAKSRDGWAEHHGERSHVHVEEAGHAKASDTTNASGAHHLCLEDGTLESSVVDHGVHPVDALHLADEVHVGLVEPFEVLTLKLGRKLLMLVN